MNEEYNRVSKFNLNDCLILFINSTLKIRVEKPKLSPKFLKIEKYAINEKLILRALQCIGTKLQNCTKIYNINLYMLLNPSVFFKINVYVLFLKRVVDIVQLCSSRKTITARRGRRRIGAVFSLRISFKHTPNT